jgi:hypothetical protein
MVLCAIDGSALLQFESNPAQTMRLDAVNAFHSAFDNLMSILLAPVALLRG